MGDRRRTTERVHDALRDDLRRRKERRTAPTAAAIDSQTVKTSHNAPAATTGYDTVKRSDTAQGFGVLPKRWIVERAFGWFVQHRRLVRDYEAHPERGRAMIWWSMADNLARRLTRTQHRFADFTAQQSSEPDSSG